MLAADTREVPAGPVPGMCTLPVLLAWPLVHAWLLSLSWLTSLILNVTALIAHSGGVRTEALSVTVHIASAIASRYFRYGVEYVYRRD